MPSTSSDWDGKRKDSGKLRMDLVPPEFVEILARICEMGAVKYSPDGWMRNPMEHTRVEASLLRHINAYQKGEKLDAESGLHHLGHAAWNALALYFYELHNLGEPNPRYDLHVYGGTDRAPEPRPEQDPH